MAAQMTAGAAALPRARFSHWEPGEVASQLTITAYPLCGNTTRQQIDPISALSGTPGPGPVCP